MATQSSYNAAYSHHHQAAASSAVHSSLLYGPSGHSAVFDVSASSPSLLYPSTPIRDLSGSASIFSQSEEQQVASSSASLTAFISTLSSPSPYRSQHHHTATAAQQYYVHPSIPYEDGLPIQTQHASPSHSRLQLAASAKESLSLAEYNAQLRHQHFLRQTAASDAGGVSPLSGQSDSHSGGDVFSNHSSDGSSRLSSSASSPSPLQLSSTPSSSPHSFASLPRDGRQPAQPVTAAAGLAKPAAAAAPSTPVYDDAAPPFPSSSSAASSSSFVPARKRKGQLNNRKIACHVCHLAKTSCDGSRPCSRCVRLGKQPLCHDRPSKVAKVGDIGSIVSARPVFAAAVPAAVVGVGDSGHTATAAAGTGVTGAAAGLAVERKEEEKRRPREERKVAEEDRDDIEEQHSDSDSHCSEEEEQEEEMQQQSAGGSEDSEAASSVDSPPSPSSFSASSSRPFNMDEYLSRSLLRAHLRWNDRQKAGDASASSSPQRMNLREKLVYFTWLTNMMRPEHVEELVHHSPDVEQKVKDAKERKQKEDEEAGISNGRTDNTSHGNGRRSNSRKQRRPSSSSSSSSFKPCDGSACDNFCPSARVWAAANPCSFTWHHSPEEAIADSASAYPQLILRSLADEEVSAEQNRRIVHNTLLLRKMEKIGETQGRMLTRHMADVKVEVEAKMRQQEQQQQQQQQQALPVERKEDGAAEAEAAATTSGSARPGSEQLHFEDMGSYQYLFCDCDSSSASCYAAPEDRAALHEFNRRNGEQQPDNTTTTLAVSTAAASITASPPQSSPTASPSSSSASLPFPSSPLLLPPQPPIEVPMSVCVNAAFERLFGWSQAELRQHLIRDGGKALYLLTRRDSWERLMELDQEANWGQQHEYRTYAVCVNKYRGEIHCLLHTVYSFNDDGKFSDSRTTFIPLPDPRPPNLRDDDDQDDDRRRRRKAKAAKNRKDSKGRKSKSRGAGGKGGGRDGGGSRRDDRGDRGDRD